MASLSQNASKKAPIHYSCRNGWFDITKRLVEQYDRDPDVRDCEGATISYQNSLGNTPLHLAVYTMVKCLWLKSSSQGLAVAQLVKLM